MTRPAARLYGIMALHEKSKKHRNLQKSHRSTLFIRGADHETAGRKGPLAPEADRQGLQKVAGEDA